MPKPTFNRLDPEKKARLLDACFDEFSQYAFSESSINRIIHQADIPRGSFYQYFESKEDCYLEVLDQIAHEKMKMYGSLVQLHEDASAFDVYLSMIDSIEMWMRTQPRFYRIGALMERDDSEFILKLQAKNPDMADGFKPLIIRDQQRGLINPELDPGLISQVLMTISRDLLNAFFLNQDYQGMRQKLKQILELIQLGTQPR